MPETTRSTLSVKPSNGNATQSEGAPTPSSLVTRICMSQFPIIKLRFAMLDLRHRHANAGASVLDLRLDYNPACIISFMFRLFRNTFYLLLLYSLPSCTSQTPRGPLQSELYVYRFDPPAFIEFSDAFQPVKEIPFSVPLYCSLLNTFPTPIGKYMVIELNCPHGQVVLFLDTETNSVIQPVNDPDSHFLAWTPDGKAAYLK